MPTTTRITERRDDALSRERIVAAAIAMLDASGEGGLTVRGLAATLNTGLGALYWHVKNKSDVLVAATDAVLADALATDSADLTPEEAIRAVALGVFDAFDAHPWIGVQLSRLESQGTTVQMLERLGQQLRALGVPGKLQFDAAAALRNYILGVAAQNAALATSVAPGTRRDDVLGAMADTWADLDPTEYPFTHGVADHLRNHDDRDQFLSGVNWLLAGITAPH
ncbi:TetR/AcrR family transcriptional regulator [Cryptosporangium sp. NPDC048952]|uniref:TetR/AcrR family transcriptional regulator n=1 Tax=Cryptosporangium sp. NPDC048952 TaxID=3363961 RepID=UPI0037238A21